MLMVRTRRSEVMIERIDRCLRVVSRVGWLVCVSCLLPLIPPPHGVGDIS